MAKLDQLRGCGTALVTPFKKDESIDDAALRRLVEYQIDEGVDFIIPCGTTGESVTLTPEEQVRVIEIVIESADGRVPVVAGAGSYNTREVINQINRFSKLGIDAILSVTPYYNRPTQEGLYQHYRAIAESTDLPVILYSVQGRTGCNLEPATVARLAQLNKIIGIKEASGNIGQIVEIALLVNENFRIFSGDDAIVLPVAALGGAGVISVVSNLLPKAVSDLCHECLTGRFDQARKLNRALAPVFKAMFIETNPIPIKAALAMIGMIEEVYRLPLVPMSTVNRSHLEKVLTESGELIDILPH
jgi:4-hydroxy-tetrahydrodipicolinate synthase